MAGCEDFSLVPLNIQLRNATGAKMKLEDVKYVFWAEDDGGLRRTFSKIVSMNFPHAKLVVVENGRILVEKVLQHWRDNGEKSAPGTIIFTDNTMPVWEGLRAIAEIRTFDKKVPIVMLSGDVDPSATASNAKNNGANGFIGKPFRLPVLAEAVEKLHAGSFFIL